MNDIAHFIIRKNSLVEEAGRSAFDLKWKEF